MNVDIVNGVFEACGAVLTWRNALQLRRDREIKGVYWPVTGFFAAWGIWNGWYYHALNQPFSWYAGLFLCAGNVAWVAQAVIYSIKNRSQHATQASQNSEAPGRN